VQRDLKKKEKKNEHSNKNLRFKKKSHTWLFENIDSQRIIAP
jgi:hypothetical protein